MVTKQTHVVRYSPMLQRATMIIRELALQNVRLLLPAPLTPLSQSKGVWPDDVQAALEDASDYQQLHSAVGDDFWVTTPCHSVAKAGHIMEGTRLTIQRLDPAVDQYEVSIRTPGTPHRWEQFDAESRQPSATCLFFFTKKKRNSPVFVVTAHFNSLLTEAKKPTPDRELLIELVHRLVFYWYNFMPLSRGTAGNFHALRVVFFS